MPNQRISRIEMAKEELESIFDAIPNPLFIHDEKFILVRVNRAYQKMTGLSFEEIIGKPYYEVFPRIREPFKICSRELESLNGEEGEDEISLPDINKIYRMQLHPVYVDNKRRYYLHILDDITEARQALEEIKREAEINKALLKATEVLSTTFGGEEIFKRVMQIVPTVINADRYTAFLYDRKLSAFVPVYTHGMKESSRHLNHLRLTAGMPIADKMIKGEMVVVEDACESSLFPKKIAEMFKQKAVMAVPIISKQVIGMIEIDRINIKGRFEDKEIAIIKGIASQMAIALTNVALYKDSIETTIELSRRLEMISVMYEIDRSILSVLEPQEILKKTTTMINRLIPCDGVTVAMLDRERSGFVYVAVWGIDLPEGQFIPFNDTTATEVIRTGRTEIVQDLSQVERLLSLEDHFLKEGFYSYIYLPMTVKDETIGVLGIAAKKRAAFTNENLLILEKLVLQIAIAMENAQLFTDLKNLFMGTVKSLANAIDASSPWTKGHSDMVTEYAIKTGREMGLQDKELEDLEIAGLFHDIGKIAISDTILNKRGELTDEEYGIVKEHPLRGVELLSPLKKLRHIFPWIRSHHERFDGRGYPDGLKGEEIPLQARILAVVDTYDAMTAERPYRKTPGREEMIEEIKRNAGSQFDPRVVEAFLKVLKDEEKTNYGG